MSRRTLLRSALVVSGAGAASPLLARPAFATTAEPVDGVLPAWAQMYAPGVSGPFDPATGMFNWRAGGARENVARTRSSLLAAAASDQHHVFVGDSLTAGWNSTTVSASSGIDRDKAWPYQYRRALTARLGLPEGGTGIVRSYECTGKYVKQFDSRWTPGPNSVSVIAKEHFLQISNTAITFTSAKSGFTPVAGSTVAVVYLDAGTLEISIDGGAFVKVPGGGTGAVRRYTVTGLPNTPHTVKIRTAFGVVGKIVGAEVHNGRGISAHNIAQGGSGATGDVQKDWSWPANGTPALSMSRCFSAAAGYARTPSTVFIGLGANDLNANATNLGKIRDGILETANYYRAGSDIVLLAEPHLSQTFSKVDVKPLLGMLYRVAYDNNWPLWDLEHFTGGFESPKAAGYVGDPTGHLTTGGYAWLGQTMAGVVGSLV